MSVVRKKHKMQKGDAASSLPLFSLLHPAAGNPLGSDAGEVQLVYRTMRVHLKSLEACCKCALLMPWMKSWLSIWCGRKQWEVGEQQYEVVQLRDALEEGGRFAGARFWKGRSAAEEIQRLALSGGCSRFFILWWAAREEAVGRPPLRCAVCAAPTGICYRDLSTQSCTERRLNFAWRCVSANRTALFQTCVSLDQWCLSASLEIVQLI